MVQHSSQAVAPVHTPTWTFLSNHSHVLLCLAREPDLRIRDLARLIGITERAVQRIIAELSSEGYLLVSKDGRRNHYQIQADQPLRHAVEGNVTVGDLMCLVEGRRLPL
jgi:predicted transcriptional regulator